MELYKSGKDYTVQKIGSPICAVYDIDLTLIGCVRNQSLQTICCLALGFAVAFLLARCFCLRNLII